MTLPASPAAARLGSLAVLPFVAGAALAWLGDGAAAAWALRALVAYAAVVASFIGAIHWGFGFREGDAGAATFVWGVAPSIVAWGSLLLPPAYGLALDAALLALCYAVDRAAYPRHGAGRWLRLRFRLSVVAVVCCAVGAAAALR